MIVADTNLVAYLIIPGASTQDAERVRARDKVWVAPALIQHELLNVMATNIREKVLERDEALRAYRRGLKTVQISDLTQDPVAILNVSISAGVPATMLSTSGWRRSWALPWSLRTED